MRCHSIVNSGGGATTATTIAHGFMSTMNNLVKSPTTSRRLFGQDSIPLEDDNYLSSEYSETDDESGPESTTEGRAQDRSQEAMVHVVNTKPPTNVEELRFTLLTNQLLHLREHYVSVER